MAEMQFPAQAPPPPGATPAATQQPAPPATPTANLDLSKYSASSLRRMLQDLRNQWQDLADRRQLSASLRLTRWHRERPVTLSDPRKLMAAVILMGARGKLAEPQKYEAGAVR